MPADEPGAQWIPSPHFWPRENTPKYIIVHGTADGSPPAAIAAYFQSAEGGNPTSTHYIIGKDGSVVQCVAEADAAWGNGIVEPGHAAWWGDTATGHPSNPNRETISIEHVKAAKDNSDPLTPQQQAASFKLIKDICQRHHIPMRAADGAGGIAGHNSISPQTRANCPGPYPWAELYDYLTGTVSGASTPAATPGIPRNPAPLNQLSEPVKDRQPDENSRDNCTFADLAWIIRDIGNEPDCDGDELKDEILGQGATGFEDLRDARYAAVAAAHGVRLEVYYGSQQQLVAKAHEIVSGVAGDVLVNVGGGSNYLAAFSDPVHANTIGHAVAIAHYIPSGLEAMNSWGGAWLDGSDAWWESRILWGYIVIALPVAVASPVPVALSGSGIPAGWHDDGTTLKDPAGAAFTGAVRGMILSSAWDPNDTQVAAEHNVQALFEDGRWGNGDVFDFVFSSIVVAYKPDPSLTGGKQLTNVVVRVPTGRELAWIRAHPAPAATPAAAPPDLSKQLAAAEQALNDLQTALKAAKEA